MTHPKARTKPRPRAARFPTDLIVLTFKGRMILATLDALRRKRARAKRERQPQDYEHGRVTHCAPNRDERANDTRAVPEAPASLPEPGESPGARSNPQHEQGCLTPCAPNRDAPAAPGPTPTTPCHVGCTPAHPAGKSEAAPLVNQPETDMRYYRPHINDANAAADAIAAHDARRIRLTPEQYHSCDVVNQAFADGAEVTQECICRAHDAIERMRR